MLRDRPEEGVGHAPRSLELSFSGNLSSEM